MRARVSGETSLRPLTTLETVATETPAASAMPVRVVRSTALFAMLVLSLLYGEGSATFRQVPVLHGLKKLPLPTS